MLKYKSLFNVKNAISTLQNIKNKIKFVRCKYWWVVEFIIKQMFDKLYKFNS